MKDQKQDSRSDELLVVLIRRGTKVFVALLWMMGLLVAAIVLWMTLDRAMRDTENAAVMLEQYARRNIELGQTVTDDFSRYLDSRGSVEGLDRDPSASSELRRLNGRLPDGSASIFVMPSGRVTAASGQLPPADVNLSDRRWFEAHVRDGIDMYIGPAITSRVIHRIIYTITKVYKNRDGQILGIINLGIPSDSLIALSQSEQDMTLALVQHEGRLVAQHPMQPDLLGETLAIAEPAPQEMTTSFAPYQGRLSLVTVKNIPNHELYAIATIPVVSVLGLALGSLGAGTIVLALLTAALLSAARLAERKSREVEQALADNKVLFQEVHHRVKNNLQVIASLTNLQTEKLPLDYRPIMQEMADRVRAIAMVHEQIYSTSSPSVVELDTFLTKLFGHLEGSLLNPGKVKVSLDLQPVSLTLDKAVPVALLATEAYTNALKHGIGTAGGRIEVSLFREGEWNVLMISDDGNGILEENTAGLGRKIMAALARQIDGNYALENTDPRGTRFVLKWPS